MGKMRLFLMILRKINENLEKNNKIFATILTITPAPFCVRVLVKNQKFNDYNPRVLKFNDRSPFF